MSELLDTTEDTTEDKAPDRSASKGKGSSSSSGKSNPKRKRSRGNGRKSLQKPLTELLSTLGAGLSMLDPFDGVVVIERAESVARALDKVARENPAVHRTLSLLVDGSGWGAVAAAVGGMLLPIAWNHGAVPDSPIVRSFVPDGAAELSRRNRDDDEAATGLGGLLGGIVQGLDLDPEAAPANGNGASAAAGKAAS